MKHTLLHCQDDESFRGYLCVAYFFNARGETLEKTPLGMLLSIVYQLLKNETDGMLYRRILPSFREKKGIYRAEPWQWRQSELQEFIRLAVRQFRSQPLVILTDALDECVESDVRSVVTFLESLSRLVSQDMPPLKLCLSSRHYPSITMSSFQEVKVEQSRAHKSEFAKYLDGKLKIRDASIQDEILRRAQGIFLWVAIVASLLNMAFDEGRVKSIPQVLQEAPSDLDEFFLTILVNKGPDNNKTISPETILTVLWVLFSRKRLLARELCAAVERTVPPTTSHVRRRIGTLSKGLVEVSDSGMVQFIHLSVEDFLVRHGRLQKLDFSLGPDPIKASHGRLWVRCWTSIEKEDFEDPLFDYAVTYILYHAENALGDDTKVRDTLTTLGRGQQSSPVSESPAEVCIQQWLRESDRWFLPWLHYCSLGHIEDHLAWQQDRPIVTLPYILAWDGLTRLFRAVLHSLDPDTCTASLSTALHVASFQGQQEIARLLITYGADIHKQGVYHVGTIGSAIKSKRPRISHGSALSAASEGGHYQIARLLIGNGADVNARSDSGDTALHAASAAGHSEIVMLLIHHGAKIDAKNRQGASALHNASSNGHTKVVQLLIHSDADINARTRYGQTALFSATRIHTDPEFRWYCESDNPDAFPRGEGHSEIIRLLIDNGVDVNARDVYDETALHTASDPEIKQLLIDNGAQVNARLQRFGITALYNAVLRHDFDTAMIAYPRHFGVSEIESESEVPASFHCSAGVDLRAGPAAETGSTH